ncbi:MAG: lytic transglycosylase domain-containing protein, partial [Oscillospiraceae bacterium]
HRLPEGTQKVEQETPVFSASKTEQPLEKVEQPVKKVEQAPIVEKPLPPSSNVGVVLVDDLSVIVGSTQFNQGSSGLSVVKKEPVISNKSSATTNNVSSSKYAKVKYSDLVLKAATKYNLPKELIFAVINVESTFNPNAVSNAGATGLMQITKDTFDWINKQTKNPSGYVYESLFDPAINIDYGCRLFSMAIKEFGNLNNAIYSYHAGWSSVKKWLANSNYSTDGIVLSSVPSKVTQNYFHKVLNAMENYK